MRLVVLGLSLSSSWGNGHATTFRALLSAFAARGHDVLFLEREQPWYAAHRDLDDPAWCSLRFYDGVDGLDAHAGALRDADAVIVGSYVPDGIAVSRRVQDRARGVRAFYDIDTPVTLAALDDGACSYLSRDTIGGFDLYLSFTAGPTLARLEQDYGARRATRLHCAVDPSRYGPTGDAIEWDLSYLGTYSADRQPAVERLLIAAARARPASRFVVAGPQYPERPALPANVERIDHLPPDQHAEFYSRSRWTLNITRRDMVRAGWSPSVRLFEAAACGTPILTDRWDGLDSVLAPPQEVLVVDDTDAVLAALALPEERRVAIGAAGRDRVLRAHTAAHRAAELEAALRDAARPVADAR